MSDEWPRNVGRSKRPSADNPAHDPRDLGRFVTGNFRQVLEKEPGQVPAGAMPWFRPMCASGGPTIRGIARTANRHRSRAAAARLRKLPLLANRSQYRENRRIRCIVAKSISFVCKNFVRRMRAVDHAPFRIVPDDRRAAQPLENAHLNLLRPQRDQPIEPRAEAVDIFARQARRSDPREHARPVSLAQKPQVVRQLRVVLPAADRRRPSSLNV